MHQDARTRYKALTARDPRFDGLFFVGVTSTSVYCRPICPARTPRETHCRFFDTAQQAEQAGFRPCLRCRPELAPGSAPVDDGRRIAEMIVQRLEEGGMEEGPAVEAIAATFELSSRQIRRILQRELGVPPIQLLLTRRLLLAKHLLTDTRLPVTDVAFASGFSSVRRFNDAFTRRYGMPPTRLRKDAATGAAFEPAGQTSTLQLSYRPPYDWPRVLAFLGARALAGVEHVTEDAYLRTVRIGTATGWLRVARSTRPHALALEITNSLTPVLPTLLRRVRALFDMDARPDVIAAHLGADTRLAASVAASPGLRVPGAFSGFEIGVRAILGQQITVRAARTLGGRFAATFGERMETPFPELTRLPPTPARVARAAPSTIARLGIVGTRARSLVALARGEDGGALGLEAGCLQDPETAIRRLDELPGIGPWTAQYIAMRAFGWPDAFPREDVAIRNALGGLTPREAETAAEAWRPWRSYAVMHLWQFRGDESVRRI